MKNEKTEKEKVTWQATSIYMKTLWENIMKWRSPHSYRFSHKDAQVNMRMELGNSHYNVGQLLPTGISETTVSEPFTPKLLACLCLAPKVNRSIFFFNPKFWRFSNSGFYIFSEPLRNEKWENRKTVKDLTVNSLSQTLATGFPSIRNY